MNEPSFRLRWMIRRDMPEVLEIERLCFPQPWPEDDFIRCLRQRNCIGMVVEHVKLEKVVGFMIYELHKLHLQLLNFAVEPAWQMRGIGRQMVDKLKSKLSLRKRQKLRLHVRETNLDAQIFFRSQGFQAISVLRDFWEDGGGEDAYLMQYRCRMPDPSEDASGCVSMESGK